MQVRSAKRRAADNYNKDIRMKKVNDWQQERLLKIPAEAEVPERESARARARLVKIPAKAEVPNII